MEVSSFILQLEPKADSRVSVGSGKSNKDDHQEQIDKIYVVPKLVAAANSAVLENVIDSLIVLGNIMDLPKISVDLDYKSLEEKYSEPFRERIYDPETLETREEALEKEKTMKFHRDRTYLEKILKETSVELATDKSYDKLVKRIKDFDKTMTEETVFLQKTEEMEMEVAKFQKRVEDEKTLLVRALQTTSENVGKLKDEFEKSSFENEVKLNYIQKWELSRYESNYTNLDLKEDDYSEVIREKNNAVDRETRIHAEIEMFLVEMTQEYEDGTLKWMDTYEKEMEQLEMDIQVLKEKREQQFEKIEELSNEYDRRTQAIADYLEVKEQRRLEEEELERRIKAAIRIQAWWRGVMVRKCLGPFRKKKGKKGKKDDKKGKKK